MEVGGNSRAAEFFKKNGMKHPIDYRSTISQKYVAEMAKRVDNLLATLQPMTQHKEESLQDKIQITNEKKEFDENEKQPDLEKKSSNPFENNIVIDQNQKPKNFSVEFTKKTVTTNQKKGLAAKKIDDFDLDSLSLEEDSRTIKQNTIGMTDSNFKIGGSDNTVKEISAKTNYSSYSTDVDTEQKLKQFSNAKAISSESFKDKSDYQATNMQKFNGASAISSAQYFGEKEEENGGADYSETIENVKDFVTQMSGKLKERAGSLFDKVKTQWQERTNG